MFRLGRNGAMGDILCILNLRDQIKKKYGPFELYCHPTYYSILNTFVKEAELCNGFFMNNRAPKDVKGVTLYPFHKGYPNKKSTDNPYAHLCHYLQDELSLPSTVEIPAVDVLSLPKPKEVIDGRKNITIQSKTGWSRYKDYPHNRELVKELTQLDFRIIQIGGPGDPYIEGAFHMQTYPFEQQMAAQCWADCHVGPDSVFNHTSNYKWSHKNKRTPSVILFGSTSHHLSGYPFNSNLSMDLDCQPCFRENPEISSQNTTPCPFDHECMKSLTVEQISSKIVEQVYLQ